MPADRETLNRQIDDEQRAIAQATDVYIREQAEACLRDARSARKVGKNGDALMLLWLAQTWLGMLNK